MNQNSIRALLVCLGLASAAGPAFSEVTRTLRARLDGDPGRAFAVENLAGTLTVVPGSGDAVEAVATVHAESQALADVMRFEQVVGPKGVPTLRVRYPVDEHRSYRYRGARDGPDGVLGWIFGGRSRTEYDGVRVSVSGNHGVSLWADVEVRLPRKAVDGHFRNVVGPLSGREVEGRLKFDTGSGSVSLSRVAGEVVADTGSGDVDARDGRGSFVCDTGSGRCEVDGFEGDRLRCDTGSGNVRIASAQARRILVDTGSGDVRVIETVTEELEADTGSGDVDVDLRGRTLAAVKADTGSGDVRLRLAPDAGFELRASTGSGDVVSRFDDAEAVVRRRKVVGYRRGDARVRISVDTGSGDIVVEPGQ